MNSTDLGEQGESSTDEEAPAGCGCLTASSGLALLLASLSIFIWTVFQGSGSEADPDTDLLEDNVFGRVEDVQPSDEGTLRVRIDTDGDDIDADGYTVAAGPNLTQPAAANSTSTRFHPILPGEYLVELQDVAPNCQVLTAPHTVTVGDAATAATWTSFEVYCYPSVGHLVVGTETAEGPSVPASFEVAGVGGASQSIGPNDSVFFGSLPGGQYEVELLAAPCRVVGAPVQTVVVSHGSTAEAGFVVDCNDTTTNVAGQWLMNTYNTAVTTNFDVINVECDLKVFEDVPVTIYQTPNNNIVEVSGLGGAGDPWRGTIDGNLLTFGGYRPNEDNGLTHAVYTLLVRENGTIVEGSEAWDWTPNDSTQPACTDGTSQVTGIRVSDLPQSPPG